MKSESLKSIFSVWGSLVTQSIDISEVGVSDTLTNLSQITNALNVLSQTNGKENNNYIDKSNIDNLQLALKDLEALLHTKGDMLKLMSESETNIKQITQNVSALTQLTIETRILSLNASVVAQKAKDEAGLKFNVIASEISNFSDKLNNNNLQINRSVKDFGATFTTFVQANTSSNDNEQKVLNNVQTMLFDLLGNLSNSISQLQTQHQSIVEGIDLINERLKSTLITLQFQDRMKQILTNISNDMGILAQRIEENKNYDIDEHIKMLQESYTTIEEKLATGSDIHHDEENIENGGLMFF